MQWTRKIGIIFPPALFPLSSARAGTHTEPLALSGRGNHYVLDKQTNFTYSG